MTAAEAGAPRRSASVVKVDASGRLVRTQALVVVPATRPVRYAPPPAEIRQIVDEAARRHDVDPLLVHSVIQTESNYRADVVSPKGAQGLMQLIPATARRFGVADSFDARANIEGGVRYLKHLQERFRGDLTLALAAYNAGEGAVERHQHAVPPYRETREYVERVGRRYEQAKRQQAPVIAAATAPLALAPAAPVEASAVESYRPVVQTVDESGRIYLRTR